ncbi:pentatricopeptide repeat-containing protein at3g42630 [Phtheirospermum japonicum]|uniref:Pentatricopeptide repeat-containing protein at3g42630 n=1 Tax=Phtheirospermum japonicum TaxID=374723 RepID=A0A830B3A0_9LAMI|nr:pentatricopeptide repeat-containing protein at3g42630 [Phtheirospermum japonicum]
MEALLLLSSSPLNLKKLFPLINSNNWKPNRSFRLKGKCEDYADARDTRNSNSLLHGFNGERLSLVPENFVYEKKSKCLLPDNSTLSALLLHYARNNLFSKALGIWDEMLNSSFVPDPELVSELIFIYGSTRDFGMVTRILDQMQLKDSKLLPDIFNLAISCFGKSGQLDCMEIMIKKMASMGYSVDSATGNAYVVYYSNFGSLDDMETAYGRLKSSRILIEEEAIRAVSSAYIKENKFYALGRFVNDVGLGRRNIGNLLWNLLLLSYAANFKMKSLQRDFVRMVESGFSPDLDTFNVRLLAFSRMCLMYDLHLSLEHMKHVGVGPDLVTYGCVVDAYLDRRMGRNLKFALKKLDCDDFVLIMTDPLVFEVMGKGDFHSSSEIVLEYVKRRDWTYKMLISIYLKKKFRSNQIFWNY